MRSNDTHSESSVSPKGNAFEGNYVQKAIDEVRCGIQRYGPDVIKMLIGLHRNRWIIRFFIRTIMGEDIGD